MRCHWCKEKVESWERDRQEKSGFEPAGCENCVKHKEKFDDAKREWTSVYTLRSPKERKERAEEAQARGNQRILASKVSDLIDDEEQRVWTKHRALWGIDAVVARKSWNKYFRNVIAYIMQGKTRKAQLRRALWLGGLIDELQTKNDIRTWNMVSQKRANIAKYADMIMKKKKCRKFVDTLIAAERLKGDAND